MSPVPPGRIFTLGTIHEKLGRRFSAVHLRRLWRRGDLPAPFYLTEKTPAWLERDLDAWIEHRAAASTEHDEKQLRRRETARGSRAARTGGGSR
jgi:predicted DNA-binding transcriptional regulator AlpA